MWGFFCCWQDFHFFDADEIANARDPEEPFGEVFPTREAALDALAAQRWNTFDGDTAASRSVNARHQAAVAHLRAHPELDGYSEEMKRFWRT